MQLISTAWGPLDAIQALQVGSQCCFVLHAHKSCCRCLLAEGADMQRYKMLAILIESIRTQGLGDTNSDFSVIGICSTEYPSSSTVAGTLVAMLSGQQQQHATSTYSEQPHGLQIHVSVVATVYLYQPLQCIATCHPKQM